MMKGEWAYFKSALSKTVCESIVEVISQRPAADATLGVNGESTDSNYRRSKIRWINSNDNELGYLFPLIWNYASIANDEWFQFNITRLPYIQVAEYNVAENAEYKRHHDVFYMNGTQYQRKLSAIVQLTDPSIYDGCNLEFYETSSVPSVDDIRAQGTITFFPSFIQHAATPIIRGVRHSMAIWCEGPHWS